MQQLGDLEREASKLLETVSVVEKQGNARSARVARQLNDLETATAEYTASAGLMNLKWGSVPQGGLGLASLVNSKNKDTTKGTKSDDTRDNNEVSLASRWEELSKDITEFEKTVDVLLKKSSTRSSNAKENNRLAIELEKATERLDVILKRFENTFKLSDDGSSQLDASQVTPLDLTPIHVPPLTLLLYMYPSE